jgi:sulfofructose kinase
MAKPPRLQKTQLPAASRRTTGHGGFPALATGAKAVDVVGLGENSVDLVAVAPRFPRPDTKQMLTELAPLVGGQAAPAMVACARLGWRARYLGSVGDDEDGRRVTDALAAAGVDVQVRVRPGVPTRRAVVLVDGRTGQRAILEHRDPAVALRIEDLDLALVTSGRLLLLDARDLELSCAAARMARAAGVPVVLDVEQPAPGVEALLRLADVIVAAGPFPGQLTGARHAGTALRRLAAVSGAPVVVATLGPEGSLAYVGGREVRTPGFQVPVVDTTGAGDAFRGGLIAAWLGAGRAVRPPALLAYANAVAALNCRALGAQAGLPTRAEIDAFVTRPRHGQSK